MVWLGPESTERSGPSVVAEGIVATTPIATPDGWRPAGCLLPGAEVMTFDNGPQRIRSAQILPMGAAHPSHWPLLVPAWSLDNRDDLVLLPEQKILLEADLAEELYGDPFALIPAQALIGWRNIDRWRPPEGAAAVILGFDAPQMIYASRGILLCCAGDPLGETDWQDGLHTSYSLTQARHLVACLVAEEAGAALRVAGQHQIKASAP